MNSQSPQAPRLARRVGLVSLTLYGLGVTVGAGIYVLVGSVAGQAGLFAPTAFLLAAIAILPTAYSFTILVSRFPVSSGEARYAHEAFGTERFTTLVGLLVGIVGIVSGATVAVGSAGYIRDLLDIPRELIIIVTLTAFAMLAIRGISESVIFAGILTLIEVGGLLLILGYGLAHDAGGVMEVVAGQTGAFAPGALVAIFPAALIAFYAFIGFEDMVNIAEEVRTPEITFPRSIFLVLIITSVVYFLITALSVALTPIEVLRHSESPLTEVAAAAGIEFTVAISMIGALAALNGVLIQLIMSSRVLYGLASMGRLPGWLAQVDPRRHTPVNAIILATALMLALALSGSVESLAALTSSITLIVFAIVNLSLIKLIFDGRIALSNLQMTAPVLGLMFSLGLLGASWLLGG